MLNRFASALLIAGAAGLANAAVNPLLEDFAADASGWRDNTSVNPLAWSPTGGPDGGPFASSTYNFVNQIAGATPIFFRAHSEFGSSGGAVFGDWTQLPIRSVRVSLRHNAGVPLTFFARFAPIGPGAVALSPTPVEPGVWTEVTFTVNPANPPLIYEGPLTYASVFSNVQRFQFGAMVPSSLAGVNQAFTFEIDKIMLSKGVACAADLDNGTSSGLPDGGVDINDLLFFLAKFEEGNVSADLDNGAGIGLPDAGVDINDLLYFLARFEAGC